MSYHVAAVVKLVSATTKEGEGRAGTEGTEGQEGEEEGRGKGGGWERCA